MSPSATMFRGTTSTRRMDRARLTPGDPFPTGAGTFVDLDGDQAEQALDRLDGTKLKGKQIRLEFAKG